MYIEYTLSMRKYMYAEMWVYLVPGPCVCFTLASCGLGMSEVYYLHTVLYCVYMHMYLRYKPVCITWYILGDTYVYMHMHGGV